MQTISLSVSQKYTARIRTQWQQSDVICEQSLLSYSTGRIYDAERDLSAIANFLVILCIDIVEYTGGCIIWKVIIYVVIMHVIMSDIIV